MPNDRTQSVSVAKSPFNHTTADVVIRTSDGVEFHLFKPILIIASSFFETMFSITQPESAHADPPTLSDPIVISEDSQTFDRLMRLVYPVDDPTFADLDILEKVLEAAIKYELAEAVKLACGKMCRFLNKQPLKVFAIACKFHLEQEAKAAAAAWKHKAPKCAFHVEFALSIAGASFVPRMSQISAGAYSRLLAYLRDPYAVVTNFSAAPPSPGITDSATAEIKLRTTKAQHDTTDADFVLLATDDVHFPVHSLILRIASAEKLLDGPRSDQPSTSQDQPAALPAILTDLDSRTLTLLLEMCYPFSHTVIKSSALELLAVYRAAERLGIQRATQLARERFKSMVKEGSNLMTLYFIAIEEAWTNDAEEIARLIAEKGLQDSYTPLMDQTYASALPLHRLLKLCNDYRVAMVTLAKQYAPQCLPESDSMDGPISSVVPNTYLPILEQLVSEQTEHYEGSMRQTNITHKLNRPSHSSSLYAPIPPFHFDRNAWSAKGNSLDRDLKKALAQLKLDLD